jgi:squalene-hopene/tetraprenyl-beta-curcumene cyclase
MRDLCGDSAVSTRCRTAAGRAAATRLEAGIDGARRAALAIQHADGHWCHELEADCTIPAEYVLMLHYFGESEPELEAKIGTYLRRRQGSDGGWPLYEAGAMDVSCSVKAYFALKLIGDDPDAEHMRHARQAIRARGGAARSNVFTRITLALFGEVPWRAVPVVPVELILLPRWLPVSLLKVSYWSRTVVVPLAVLCSLKPRAANPRCIDVRELFLTPPDQEKHYFPSPDWTLAGMFLRLDRFGHRTEKLIPRWVRRYALKRAERWIQRRLNGTDGLGAIFPAMVNALEAMALMGHAPDSKIMREARQALTDLLIDHGDEAYCQPCVSPVWDTGLMCLAMQEDRRERPAGELDAALSKAHAWLLEQQLLDAPGDWRRTHPALAGGGWPFQYHNAYYPDLDDTAVIAWALHQSPEAGPGHATAVARAADWLVGMQSRNGGFGAFDSDNNSDWLNQIPFADHGALLDPPTSDVSARVLTFLTRLDRPQDRQARQRVLAFLRRQQLPEGCWFGRWGCNYIYGTWSALVALEAAGIDHDDEAVQRAVAWFETCQREDGSWGESNDSYFDPTLAGRDSRGSAAQTAWALLGLMAAGEVKSEAVARGVERLLVMQGTDGRWHDPGFNAPGFPRVFYLKYHGYDHYFPYWALARYRHLRRAANA